MDVDNTALGGNYEQRDRRGAKPKRRPKSGNSELFQEILSSANALSVTERVRLVKSLAGQLGLVTVGAQELLDGKTVKKSKGKAAGPPMEVTLQRPNPLKGTKFAIEKDLAYKALVAAKQSAGGEKLPLEHPAVAAYAAALGAYKAAHSELQVVFTPSAMIPQQIKSAKTKARTTSDRSPEPGQTQPMVGMLGRLKRVVAGTSKKSKALPEADEQLL
jgi:hypothetical protein